MPHQDLNRTALVIGVTGSFGGHAAAALQKRGWAIRALARDPVAAAAKAGPKMPIDWVKGDAMDAAAVTAAAEGAGLIVHAANPPGYRNWAGTVVPMLRASLAAARAHGGRIVLPGNVYNYAPDAGAHIAEDAPQAPTTRKGRLRVEMEILLREAAEREGVRSLVLRAGDFFGPAAPNSALGWLTRRSGGRLRTVYAPGPAGVGHAFAYLPDLAQTLALLAEREDDLRAFETFHFTGHWLERDDLGPAIRRVAGDPRLPIRPFPYPVVRALSPFVETFRELLEMRYLWLRPIGLDNGRLLNLLGAEPHTPLDAALRATFEDMGCLPSAGPRGAQSGPAQRPAGLAPAAQ